jgi:hypothetical protein
MLAWAKTTRANPIAAAANAKPIFRFIGNPSSKPKRKANCYHRQSLCWPSQKVAFRCGSNNAATLSANQSSCAATGVAWVLPSILH